MTISKEIQQALKDYSSCRAYPDSSFTDAKFGYQLAQQTIKDKDEEIERLKGLMEKLHEERNNARQNSAPGDSSIKYDTWQKFKTENQL